MHVLDTGGDGVGAAVDAGVGAAVDDGVSGWVEVVVIVLTGVGGSVVDVAGVVVDVTGSVALVSVITDVIVVTVVEADVSADVAVAVDVSVLAVVEGVGGTGVGVVPDTLTGVLDDVPVTGIVSDSGVGGGVGGGIGVGANVVETSTGLVVKLLNVWQLPRSTQYDVQ